MIGNHRTRMGWIYCLALASSLGGCLGQVDAGSVPGGDENTPSTSIAGLRPLEFVPWSFGMCALFDDAKVRCWRFGRPETLQTVHAFDGAVKFASSGSQGQACAIDARGAVNCLDSSLVGPLTERFARGVVDLTLGFWGGCAILDDGTVKCWGSAGPDACAGGDSQDVTDVPLPRPAVEVRNTDAHTCARTDDGHVYCFGTNSLGESGVPVPGLLTLEDSPNYCIDQPTEVPDISDAIGLGLNMNSTCVLRASGRVTCFGEAQLLGSAQPGDTGRGDAVALDDVAALSASRSATCALRSNAKLSCWGVDEDGALGTSASKDAFPLVRTPLEVQPERDFLLVGMQDGITCGFETDHTISCWGFNKDEADPRPYTVR